MVSRKPTAENRVRQVRKAKGLSMEELGAKMVPPVHFTTIAKIERSQRRLTSEMLSAIAEALDVDPRELIDQVPAMLPVRSIPIVGKIAAGNWREAVQDPQGHIAIPIGGANAFALEPEGDSMDKVVKGGRVLVIVDPDRLDLRDGLLYAIMNNEGETTFKQFRSEPPRLEPLSNNPAHVAIPLGREPFTVIGEVVGQFSIFDAASLSAI